MNKSKPFLKWVGGKTQLLPDISEHFPTEINNYHEVFLGGGSVLFHLLDKINVGEIILNGNIYAYDYNVNLINVYKHIQTEPDNLFKEIMKHKNKLSSLADEGKTFLGKGRIKKFPETVEDSLLSRESYYYWQRDWYNKLDTCLEKSALFIFLNKICFRGVYREGPHGFNVPYGGHIGKDKKEEKDEKDEKDVKDKKDKKIPEIITLKYLKDASELLKKVIFESCDFKESFKNIKLGDFVYLDPPYAPENSKSFVGYNEGGFDLECHNDLLKLCNGLTDKKISFMMSNASVKLIQDSFEITEHYIIEVNARRSINSKNPEAKTKEVIITNY